MNDNDRWVRPLGSAGTAEWSVAIDESTAGWSHTRLLVADLADGQSRTVVGSDWEHVVVPLSGRVTVRAVDADGAAHATPLTGRECVFSGPTDVAYLSRDCELTVTAEDGPARVAVCGARARSRTTPPLRRVDAAEVPVELRGAGSASREVRNFGVPGVLEADSIIACEVVTPAGNWSSYPPHKHDEERPGLETELEEIYYFEVQPTERSELGWTSGEESAEGGPRGAAPTERSELGWTSGEESAEGGPRGAAPTERSELGWTSGEQSAEGGAAPTDRSGRGAGRQGLGYQRVYGTDERPIDVLAEVRSGDVVLVPHGWHGPAMAAPGYDLYYLNVMAGPGPERAWLICDDPEHGWVRETWPAQPMDPRLPLGGAR